MGVVYCAQNKIDQKIYIGQSTLSLNKRIVYHKGYVKQGAQTYFHRAIRKHGFDQFLWCILSNEDDEDKLNELEIYWIKELEATNKEYGYNLCEGGHPGGRLVSIERKKELSEKYKGEGNPFYGKKHSEESKRMVSETKKGNSPPWNKGLKTGPQSEEWVRARSKGMMGHHVKEETKQKIRKAQKGKSLTEEHKINIGIAGKGRIVSKETKKKLSIATSKQWSDPVMRRKIGKAIKNGKRWRN